MLHANGATLFHYTGGRFLKLEVCVLCKRRILSETDTSFYSTFMFSYKWPSAFHYCTLINLGTVYKQLWNYTIWLLKT